MSEDSSGPAGPEPGSQDGSTAEPTSENVAGSSADTPSSADARTRFAAAIERKRSAGQARRDHLDGGAKVGGATANHKTSRTFRRKSG